MSVKIKLVTLSVFCLWALLVFCNYPALGQGTSGPTYKFTSGSITKYHSTSQYSHMYDLVLDERGKMGSEAKLDADVNWNRKAESNTALCVTGTTFTVTSKGKMDFPGNPNMDATFIFDDKDLSMVLKGKKASMGDKSVKEFKEKGMRCSVDSNGKISGLDSGSSLGMIPQVKPIKDVLASFCYNAHFPLPKKAITTGDTWESVVNIGAGGLPVGMPVRCTLSGSETIGKYSNCFKIKVSAIDDADKIPVAGLLAALNGMSPQQTDIQHAKVTIEGTFFFSPSEGKIVKFDLDCDIDIKASIKGQMGPMSFTGIATFIAKGSEHTIIVD
ncbi:hypothetical protein ACFL54_04410 [Planctomycetota bacterium]